MTTILAVVYSCHSSCVHENVQLTNNDGNVNDIGYFCRHSSLNSLETVYWRWTLFGTKLCKKLNLYMLFI